MRGIALGVVSALVLTLLTSCDVGDSGLVGEWAGQHGLSMIFYPDGRVAIRDESGIVPDCKYEYNLEKGEVTITRPTGVKFTANLITAHRMETRSLRGTKMIFSRKGT